MINHDMLLGIASRQFDGNAASGTRLGKGPRREYIWDIMKYAGLKPFEDEYGNLWVGRGSRGEYRIYSSHMDIDARIPKTGLQLTEHDGVYSGVLDNAVGCYLNLMTALHNNTEQRARYVFTASEEECPADREKWARSARNVVATLQKAGVKPELCVAVDVTYPRLLITQEELDKITEEAWDETPAERMFDLSDAMHCYIDSLQSREAEIIAQRLLNVYQNGNIKTRQLTGFDEASVYKEIAPAFAFGPVGYGKYTDPEQRMPSKHIVTAQEFLRFLTDARIR